MSIQTHFNIFDKNIYLTSQSTAYKKAREKDESILQEIKNAFKDADYPIIDSFMQGSFSVNTAINSIEGDFDIDRAIVIESDTAPEDPLIPKKLILDILTKRNFENPKVKKPCVTADYLSTNLHIDYIVYKRVGENYSLAVGKLNSAIAHKEWSASDPKGLSDWINTSVNYGESQIKKKKQYKRLVRYIKRWRDVNFTEEVRKKIFSIGLTVMVKEQYKPNYFDSVISDDLSVLKTVIVNILASNYFKKQFQSEDYRVYVNLPKKPYRDIFQHKIAGGESENGSDLNVGNQLRNKLIQLQNKLQNILDEVDEIKQCTILNGIFGSDFQIPSKSDSSNGGKVAAGATVFPSAGASGTSQGA
ncbi:MAG: nucleotidyltransferase [Pseudomonadales bacterium]|nr:nucleotidyltransferase [Pseudomonadales bacterium]